jgi:phospholipid/cholesterol/gamma-HCH transport system substrate-binding protein
MRRAIREHSSDFAALVGLIILAAAVASYIIANQEARPKFPLIEKRPLTLLAEFSDAQAVTPGQGQSVRVAGVQIGLIRGVGIQEGKAVVTMEIDGEYSRLIHEDAFALLRPRTGLKDMFIEIDPGSKHAPLMGELDRIEVANTSPDIDPDEVLSALDTDTRAYLSLLINGGGQGLKNNGDDLREVFRRFGPLHRDLARVQKAIAERRYNLRRLVHNYGSLVRELGDHDREIVRLVTEGNETLEAFANEDENVSATVAKLAPALRQTETALVKVDRFSDQLGPTLERLRPAFRRIEDANRELIPLGREATPILRTQIRPFVREARPFVRNLRPAARDLANATPELTTSVKELNRLFNMAAYNPDDDNYDRDNYLFWIAWTAHNTVSLFSTADASGPFRPTTVSLSCETLRDLLREQPGLAAGVGFLDAASGVVPALDDGVCPDSGEGD